jgi:hypothetical protein
MAMSVTTRAAASLAVAAAAPRASAMILALAGLKPGHTVLQLGEASVDNVEAPLDYTLTADKPVDPAHHVP